MILTEVYVSCSPIVLKSQNSLDWRITQRGRLSIGSPEMDQVDNNRKRNKNTPKNSVSFLLNFRLGLFCFLHGFGIIDVGR